MRVVGLREALPERLPSRGRDPRLLAVRPIGLTARAVEPGSELVGGERPAEMVALRKVAVESS